MIAATLTSHLASANCIHGTSLHRREEGPGGTVKVSSFGYTGLRGPLNWAGLAPENSACVTSSNQSPVNIDNTISLATEAPVIVIPSVEAAEFENLGSTIEVIVNGTTTVGGTKFDLKQFHFHTPSEHRIAEEYFPLEVHMVHEAADGSGAIAVLAVTFQLSEDGTTTELLTAVTEKISEIAVPGTVTETGPLDFAPLIKHLETTPLFQYKGSLTTPPCAEGLTFLVTKEPLPLNVKTFNAIKSIVKFNSRYTQNSLGEENLVGVASTALAAARSPAHPAPSDPSGSAILVEAEGKRPSPTVEDVSATTEEPHCIMGACHTRRIGAVGSV
ncbi:hypothetical protein Q9L58_004225 [Maublancomyces gigas]|uniref:Carbonic anhydrase n=1 Tax=Discina gigas TaxID=1032678 RepID=A0ABR3GLK1_9PEZI